MSDPDYDELESDFGEIMAILREGKVEPPTERPSDAVWDAIAGEVGGSLGDRRTSLRSVLDPSDGKGTTEPGRGTGSAGVHHGGADVRDITSARSWRRRGAILATAAAAVVLVGVPVYLVTSDDGVTGRRAELAALGGFDGTGVAELDDHTLSIDLEGIVPQDGAFYELWLLDAEGEEVRDLRSLGRVESDGTFQVPDDVDLDRFTVVDVSIEPDDGNPDHSGASILRGGLTDL